jgi:hypothetical protein
MQLIYSHRDIIKERYERNNSYFSKAKKKGKNPDKHTNKILFEKRKRKKKRDRIAAKTSWKEGRSHQYL